MLLVDDDQTQAGERQEQSGPGADHYTRRPARHPLPRAPAPRRRQAGVPLLGRDAQPPSHAGDHRLGENNLRQKDQRLRRRLAGQQVGDGFEIHLGLARAGDAVQQQGREAVGERRADRRRRGGLAGIEVGGGCAFRRSSLRRRFDVGVSSD